MRPETNGNNSQSQIGGGITTNLQNRSERSRIRVFVRQPFTESGNTEKEIIQGALDVLGSLDVDVITGLEAQSQDTFRTSFEKTTGMPFTPGNFRAARLGLLQAADAMVFIRTSLSESGAFEAAYNVYAGRRVPMFFAIWKHAPIKTTLLRDLDEFCTAEYVTFETPEELRSSLARFLIRTVEERRTSSYQMETAADAVVSPPALDPNQPTRRLRAKAVRQGLPH
jgi:carbamoyl-phosphate synthase large subunit